MSSHRIAFGRWGEDQAAAFLERNGYLLLDRNVHTAHGELDLVARKDQVLVFVEVKTRRSHAFAFPEESVTPRKQAHMLSAAEWYLDRHPECGDTWQFDVIAVEGTPAGTLHIEHFENVIA